MLLGARERLGPQQILDGAVSRAAGRAERIARRLSYLSPSGKVAVGPQWVVLNVNNNCNLHCKMCDVGTGTEDTTFFKNLIANNFGNMSLELFDRVLSDARGFEIRPRLSFAYTEPGIHPRIGEMVAQAKRAGFYVSLTTNGFTLPKLAETFVQEGLDQLFVSIDGTRDIHNDVRGDARSYDRIMDGLATLTELRGDREAPRVMVGFVFTEQSYECLPELLDELRRFRPLRVVATLLSFIHPESAAAHNRQFGDRYPVTVSNLSQVDLAGFDFERLARTIRAAKARAKDHGIDLSVHPNLSSQEDLRRYHEQPTAAIAGDHCVDPWNMVMVQTNGDVVPSHGRCFNTIVGNLEQHTLRELWNGDQMVGFRKTLKAEGGLLPACTRCCGCYDHRAGTSDRAAFSAQRLAVR